MDNSLVVLVIIVLALLGLLSLVAYMTKPKLNKAHFKKKWDEVMAMDNLTLAVIKADALVDEALRHAGMRGETMGERLNNSNGVVSDVTGAWSAHKLRNRLVHESDAKPTDSDCKRALRQCKKSLKDLGAL